MASRQEPQCETLTVLRARGRRLAKLITADGTVVAYDAPKIFDLHEHPVTDVGQLEEALCELLARPDLAIVRGAVAVPTRTRGVRRLVHRCPETGDEPTLVERARRWLALDVDGLPLPAGLDARDLAGCGAYARDILPPAFHLSPLLVVASASHGIKPGARLRLWAWLDRALTGAEVSRWLRDTPVDHAVFRPAQLIYTAGPVFVDGVSDPLSTRLITLPGAVPQVPVPPPEALAPKPARYSSPLPKPSAPAASRYALSALISASARVAGAAVNSRHYTMVSEARGLARLVNAGLLAESDVRRALGRAAERCGKAATEADAVVTWALAHASNAAIPEGVA